MQEVKINQSDIESLKEKANRLSKMLISIDDQFRHCVATIDWEVKANAGINSATQNLSNEINKEKDLLVAHKIFLEKSLADFIGSDKRQTAKVGDIASFALSSLGTISSFYPNGAYENSKYNSNVNALGENGIIKNDSARATEIGMISSVISEKENNSNFDANKLGHTLGNIGADKSRKVSDYNDPYGKNNIFATSGYIGQCTWYANGRFQEVTGIKLNSGRSADKWLDSVTNPDVNITRDMYNISSNSVAVYKNLNGSANGHVIFIENVERDAAGNPLFVYFTEANADGNGAFDAAKDGILKKLPFDKFINRNGQQVMGYISAK